MIRGRADDEADKVVSMSQPTVSQRTRLRTLCFLEDRDMYHGTEYCRDFSVLMSPTTAAFNQDVVIHRRPKEQIP